MAKRLPILASGIASAALLGSCGGGSPQQQAAAPVTVAPTPSPTPAPTPAPTTTTLPGGPMTSFADRTAAMQIGHSFGFTAGLNPMVAQFAGGAAAGDIDGDGDIDVFVARGDM